MATERQAIQNSRASARGATERVMPQTLPGADQQASNMPRRLTPVQTRGGDLPLEFLFDVPVTLVFEVGRIDITIKQLLELNKGSVLELRNVLVDVIDIRINDKIMAYGETIALQQRYGIRFGELEEFTGVEDLENVG